MVVKMIGSEFVAPQISIASKNDLINGFNPPRTWQSPVSPLFSAFFSLHPAQSIGPDGGRLFLTCISNLGSLYADYIEFSGGINSITFLYSKYGIDTAIAPRNAPQPGTTNMINTGDNRVLTVAWFKHELWFAFNTSCFTGRATHSCIRIGQASTKPSGLPLMPVLQDFNVGNVDFHVFYPSLKITSQGNIGFIFGASGSNMFPSLFLSGQTVDDRPSNLDGPALALITGSAALYR